MRAGKIAGVTLSLNIWFVALMLLYGAMGMLGQVMIVFACVAAHEGMHALAARFLGYKVREVELLPFGGVARIEGLDEAAPGSEMFMAVAGPAASLLLAGMLRLTQDLFPVWAGPLQLAYQTNIMLALFNLLPALPLDGGRIFRAWLSQYSTYQKATHVTIYLGLFLSSALFTGVIADFVYHRNLNITLFLLAAYLPLAARKEMMAANFRSMRILSRKKIDLRNKGIMPTGHYTALETQQAKDVLALFGAEKYYVVLVVDDGLRLKGSLTETEIWEGMPDHGVQAKMKDFLRDR